MHVIVIVIEEEENLKVTPLSFYLVRQSDEIK